MSPTKNKKKALKHDPAFRALSATSSEIHLQQYPVFCLKPEQPGATRIIFRETVRQGQVSMTRQWTVGIQSHLGWPGEHEAEVWRAIEHILHLRFQDKKLENPLRTTFTEIREHMSGTGVGGTNFKRIRNSLNCLQGTSISADFFYHNEPKLREGLQFSLISSVGYRYSDRITSKEDRRYIDAVKVSFDKDWFANVKTRFVRPLDKGLRDQLRRPIAKRLYEILAVKFFPLRKKKVPYITGYLRLCSLIGMTPQRYFSDAKRVLGRAHKELQEKDYLAEVEWFSVTSNKSDWVLHYWPGSRAKSEWRKEHWRHTKLGQSSLFVEVPKTASTEPVWVDRPDESTNVIDVTSVIEDPDESQTKSFDSVEMTAEPLQALTSTNSKDPTPVKLSFKQEVLAAFERGTGQPRRMKGLSDAEKMLIKRWNALEITPEDIENGVRESMKREQLLSIKLERPMNEIWSLDYCRADVEAFSSKRKEFEKQYRLEEERYQKIFEEVRARHRVDPQLQEMQQRVEVLIEENFPKALHGKFIIYSLREDRLALLAASEEIAMTSLPYSVILTQALGRPVMILQPEHAIHFPI